jgi:hypothetical protein
MKIGEMKKAYGNEEAYRKAAVAISAAIINGEKRGALAHAMYQAGGMSAAKCSAK